MAGLERVVGAACLVGQLPYPGVDDGRRHAPVVQQRRVRGEALLAHQLLAVEVALLVAVLGVPGRWHRTHAAVVGHGASLNRFARPASRRYPRGAMRDFPPEISAFFSAPGQRPGPAPDTRSPVAFLRWMLRQQWQVIALSTAVGVLWQLPLTVGPWLFGKA